MTGHPGAQHGLGDPGTPERSADPDDMTWRDCQRGEEEGRLVNAATGEPFTYRDACVAFGPATQHGGAGGSGRDPGRAARPRSLSRRP